MQVLFNDLAAQYQAIRNEVGDALQQVLHDGWYVGGDHVKSFETEFAKRCGVTHAIGLGNATDGLFLALKALNIQPGDEVITPAWSWISSAEVITQCGARVVFADVAPDTFTISANAIQNKITSKTKAIVVVHLYGKMVEIQPIRELCNQHKIKLIEDCSQAHFAETTAGKVGTIGDCGIFSFYPTKNLGAFGDAGCLITNNEALALRVRRLANHGGLTKDEHLFEGMNSRLDSLQAAILMVKLTHIETWTNTRRLLANTYIDNLRMVKEIVLPCIDEPLAHVFHLFVIRAQRREELRNHLEKLGVQTLIHYPKALPFEPAYAYLNHPEQDFPVAFQLQREVLSLPLHPFLSREQIEYVCWAISSFYGH
ncbi:MAG: DegT/DnrJ/EryC1/StrS family aminotransferase [Bacteroidetes bacterium CHB5]|nr:DegT/DnrJ/EryC1/StrS family aminotransferase [Bacteroidetes bacterium CHB5]